MASFRVMTLNVWSGLTYKGVFKMGYFEDHHSRAQRFEGLVAEIERLKPDIIGINEANPLPHYCEELASRTGYECIWHMGVSGLRVGKLGIPVNLREGDAILAKKGLNLEFIGQTKLSGHGFVKPSFSFHTDDLTQAVLGSITIEGKRIYICITHWHATIGGKDVISLAAELKKSYSYSDSDYKKVIKTITNDIRWKMREASKTVEWLKINVPEGAPLILMGDLNACPDDPEIAYLRAKGLNDLLIGDPSFTWDPQTNTNLIRYYPQNLKIRFNSIYDHLRAVHETTKRRTIDYVMINDQIKQAHAQICAVKPYKTGHISDHYGVLADILIK
jgi:endonuclease/exonuclease/phosphatase family metal-dependent hydrolase